MLAGGDLSPFDTEKASKFCTKTVRQETQDSLKRVNGEFTQANCPDNVMKGMNFKSSATQTDDGKGLMALGALNH